MKTSRLLRFLPLAVLTWVGLPAALPIAAQQQLNIKHGCAYKTAAEETTLYTFEPSDEARRIVGEICNVLAVSQNFDLRAASVDNALATTEGKRRIILYSTVFLKKFNEDARTRWAAYSVLAHEVGHHFNGHDFAESSPAKRKQWELEADRFAGSALRMLGATLDEAKAGVETFALDAEQQYHPSGRARREAIATGWTQKQELLEKMGAGGNTNPDTGLPRERDTDADGIPDRNDACPDEYGRALTAGCPDADEDGVPDRDDACRYRKGPASWKGCPDSDGDGLPDHEDQCPDKAGYAADKGCPPPDRDADAVPDRADKCPDAYGLPRFQGCPDSDGDGVPDPDDKCPTEKGDPLYNGCASPLPTGEGSGVGLPDNMVFVKGGTFQMGSDDSDAFSSEKPVHTVRISDFYLGRTEVTVAEFKAFVEAKGYQTDAEKEGWSYCWTGTTWDKKNGVTWRDDTEGKRRPESEYKHPVIHVSWNDAKAYCAWMSERTGKKYRLPSEAEWEYAAGNGAKHHKYSWGDGLPAGKKGGNVADESLKKKFSGWTIFEGYDDGYVFTAPAGSFDPNELGLCDMTGNVWEWCEDWYHSDYNGAPSDGSAWLSPAGSNRVLRGGSWFDYPQGARAAYRGNGTPAYRLGSAGFRLARTN